MKIAVNQGGNSNVSCFISDHESKVKITYCGLKGADQIDLHAERGRIKCFVDICKPDSTSVFDENYSNIVETAVTSSIILEKLPKMQIMIEIKIMQNGQHSLGYAITGTSIVLSISGIDMYDMVLAYSENNDNNMEPNLVSIMPMMNHTSITNIVGRYSELLYIQKYQDMLNKAKSLYPHVYKSIVDCIKNLYSTQLYYKRVMSHDSCVSVS
ncbi:hypothetical protein A3Q56_03171 [Intoshia linei]|uniref:Uncharacterized protein n=1 Tax=Intoshia linei TaxID=1819745 RepID=A0A177B473_9BILA|nr:hypothetical protein A3Q56_03171 [Intoshia linei]